jgi:hypothetical protein
MNSRHERLPLDALHDAHAGTRFQGWVVYPDGRPPGSMMGRKWSVVVAASPQYTQPGPSSRSSVVRKRDEVGFPLPHSPSATARHTRPHVAWYARVNSRMGLWRLSISCTTAHGADRVAV